MMPNARLILERIIFIVTYIGTIYTFWNYMNIYNTSIKCYSFLALIVIYTASYILAILPEVINSIKDELFYKTRKNKIYSHSLRKDEVPKKRKKKDNNKGLKFSNSIDTNLLYIHQGNIKYEYINRDNLRMHNTWNNIEENEMKSLEEGNYSSEYNSDNEERKKEKNIYHGKINENKIYGEENQTMDAEQMDYHANKGEHNMNDEINDYILKKKEKNKKYIIDSIKDIEDIFNDGQTKTLKMKDQMIQFIELNCMDSELEEANGNENNHKTSKKDFYTMGSIQNMSNMIISNNMNSNEDQMIYNKKYQLNDLNSYIHMSLKDIKRSNESFLYDVKYLNAKTLDFLTDNRELSLMWKADTIRAKRKQKKRKYIYFMFKSGKDSILGLGNSYFSWFKPNGDKYVLDSFYERNKQVKKVKPFSRWHNLLLKIIIDIKVTYLNFCKNSSFLISDLIVTIALLLTWIGAYNYFRRNDPLTDHGMFNWNTDHLPNLYITIEGYLQSIILYDICVKLILFFTSHHMFSFWFVLNMLNTPFLYILISKFTMVKYERYGWLYLTGPFRFINILRMEKLFVENTNRYNKLNLPIITLSMHIIILIYTYACIHLLIEQPCKGDYQLYDYIFSVMQTLTTAALGRGTCFPFSLESKIVHIFYICMVFTYLHYKIRYLKNHLVEDKQIYGKIPSIRSRYFVIIGHIKPIALYVIINELQSTYNNIDDIIILTSLPVRFYLNIIKLLNKNGLIQISLCRYDLNKPFPLTIKKIISYSIGIFICNNIVNTYHNINNDMETLKRYNEIKSLGPFNKYTSVLLNNMCNYNILLKKNYRNIICLNDLKMKLFAKTMDDCPGMFLLILLLFINIPQKNQSKSTDLLKNYFDEINLNTGSENEKKSRKKKLYRWKNSTNEKSKNDKLKRSHTSLGNNHNQEKGIKNFENKKNNNYNIEIIEDGKNNNYEKIKDVDLKVIDENTQRKANKISENIKKEKYIFNIFSKFNKNKKRMSLFPYMRKNIKKKFFNNSNNEYSYHYNSYNNYLDYIKGIKYNIYKIKLPTLFFDLYFTTIAHYMYMNYNAFVIGIINEYSEIKLNPINYIYKNEDVQFILLTDKYNILQKIQNIKSIQFDWNNNIESIKIKINKQKDAKKKLDSNITNKSIDKSCNNYYNNIKKLKCDSSGKYFDPVLNIFRVDNYLQALEIFKLREKQNNHMRSSSNETCYSDVDNKMKKNKNGIRNVSNKFESYENARKIVSLSSMADLEADSRKSKNDIPKRKTCKKYTPNFMILINWAQSLNTFLKILYKRKKHNIIILSDNVPAYIYNNNLSKYNICYIQKSPLIMFNLIIAGILVCKKCVIFKNYLKLNSYENIISHNEKTGLNYFEYMCKTNDNDAIIIFNNIQNIFRRRDKKDAYIDFFINENNNFNAYNDYLKKKMSMKNEGNTYEDEERKKLLKKIKKNDNKNKRKNNIYLLIELNNTLCIQYLNNDAYTTVNVMKSKLHHLNMHIAHNLLFIENYKRQILFFKYGNLLVENVYKKIEHIFVDNYYFYLYFLQFTSSSVFVDELIYHLIGYTFPINNNSIDISIIESFIHGTYSTENKKFKTNLLLKNIKSKYHGVEFFCIFQKYLKKGAIIIGVYRLNEDNDMSVVIPCPERNFIMHKTDRVYVIQSEYKP
ncbi:conserved Plasmodium protein, unknown function [Plasmodium berghei]|uniref:Potassium channel n=2 Tax=Plasmodium berghei TaxID=5821 RepID=A0A509AQU1_PLABA|nr:conserved Plasmodium protein, unknown function [Plasmodium berghei ANKA]CXI50188.1 conserved Plasmodium protein, unknown function [Plasmodium berghei]SCL94205.1 conserved Plasmodium protein, unknown function [Plasmodium berghei]SCM15962.1 conserved Plasmodium protein, unknown function [Plasmodium berghei]SCM17758.1 conserved Plasmodium protein, unknown function [Plasmodium berghei]SCN25966.1 conserved Plasmodium protein, unknown function [Plasmodium berghei]|eukprot:XP_034421887.1 conserved Plasmodium protein, unknown function [Plasmodium berghei ANKA]